MRLIKSLPLVFFTLFIFAASVLQAQVYNPIKWKYETKDLGDNKFELQFTATLDPTWHLYSQHLPSDDGPIATAFDFSENAAVEKIGAVSEPESHKEYDPNFDMELAWFEGKVTFKQVVKLLENSTTVKGEMTYMVCDPSKCLPPEYVEFEFPLTASAGGETGAVEGEAKPEGENMEMSLSEEGENGGANEMGNKDKPIIYDPVSWKFDVEKAGENEFTITVIASIEEGWHLYSQHLESEDGPIATAFTFTANGAVAEGETIEKGEKHNEYDPNFMMNLSYYEKEVTFSQKVKVNEVNGGLTGEVYFMVCNDKMCLPPEAVEFTLTTEGENAGIMSNDEAAPEDVKEDKKTEELPEKKEDDDKSFMAVFLLGFAGGLFALLTPCVFPMIPLTVSFFTKQSKNKAQGKFNAIAYGLSIIAIYTGLGVGATMIFGPDALHALSTNLWFNLSIFALLVVFAISFFGAFEITLPSSWSTKMDDSASKKGGLIGIFLMAATLSIVSFSCTGPIIGSVISLGSPEKMSVTLFGFSVALGLPFGLFAMFPGWLNSLPQSGGWLNSVKVTLGFIELAFAFKFLSNADLVEQWHFLEREMFIAIWIACFGGMAAYLFGAIKFPHDSPMDRLPVPRVMLGLTTVIFTLYLIPGLWGAPLKLIAGFPPPSFYAESPFGLYKVDMLEKKIDRLADKIGQGGITSIGGSEQPTHKSDGHCPMDLNCFHDFEEGLAFAKKVNKPVLLDFTGWACVNCRKMEEEVWSDSNVWNKLNDEFVVVSLYTDQNEKLPEEEQFYSEALGKQVKRVGQKWVDLEIKRYGNNAQPHYVITDHEGNSLQDAANYDPDIPKFIKWLDNGKAIFSKK